MNKKTKKLKKKLDNIIDNSTTRDGVADMILLTILAISTLFEFMDENEDLINRTIKKD